MMTVTTRRSIDANEARRLSREEDARLVQGVRDANEESFNALVEKYSGRVFTLVSGMIRDRIEVEDVVQEVFFKVHRKLPGFEGKSAFYTWLYRVTLNTATDHLKKKRLDRIQTIEDVATIDVLDVDGDAPTADLDRADLRRSLAEAVADLPSKYRDILVLREYEGCSYEEIAGVLKCSKGTVESRLFRARARLREKLSRYLH